MSAKWHPICVGLNMLSYDTAEVSSYLKVFCWNSYLGRLPGLLAPFTASLGLVHEWWRQAGIKLYTAHEPFNSK